MAKYGDLTLGQVEAVVNKLGGVEGVRELLDGKKKIITMLKTFPAWGSVTVGDGPRTAGEFCEINSSLGSNIAGRLRKSLRNNNVSFSEVSGIFELDLVWVSVAELGFESGTTRRNIYYRADQLGLSLCPVETGFQLIQQYRNQPGDGETAIIAMEPVWLEDDVQSVFCILHVDSGYSIDTTDGQPDKIWSANRRFVFVRRK